MRHHFSSVIAFAVLFTATLSGRVEAAGPVSKEKAELTFADLPFEMTSFGAARVGNHALVYGGHNGGAHSYSTEEQSNELLALDLEKSGAEWEKLAEGDRLQGLAMVPYKNSVILVGGFTAMNARGEEHDLHSRDRVRQYDLNKKEWAELPSLPSGRSSHDAAILNGIIYVVGGWKMDGDNETTWHTTALKMDMNAKTPVWEEMETPPFVRRALAVVAHQGKIYAIGGMQREKGPTTEVNVYDPATNKWSSGPALAGESGMAGFGAAGWSVGGTLLVSTYEGAVLTMQEDGQGWLRLGKTQDNRFFHRLIPISGEQVVSVGGANMESGKYLNLEVVDAK